MQLDLSPDSLVNAAGAAVFLLEGILILALSYRKVRGVLVGSLATTFGLTYIVQNLVVSAGDMWLIGVAGLLSAGFGVALTVHLVRNISLRVLLPLLAGALALAALTTVFSIVALADPLFVAANMGASDGFASLGLFALVWQQFAFVILLAAAGVRIRNLPAGAVVQRQAVRCLALAFGLFGVFVLMPVATIQLPSTSAAILAIGGLAFGVAAIVAVVVFLPSSRSREPRSAWATYWALVAAGLGGLVLALAMDPPYAFEFGAFGVVRTIGGVLLAVAVLRFDLLEVPLPRLAMRSGVAATSALGALFIVAQIAQNFLASRYGILLGGIVAGVVLFAASPLQRAIEAAAARTSPRPPTPKAGSGRPSNSRRREAAYVSAVRLAIADRSLTRAEEIELHRLAAELGIDSVRAHELLSKTETTLAKRKRPSA